MSDTDHVAVSRCPVVLMHNFSNLCVRQSTKSEKYRVRRGQHSQRLCMHLIRLQRNLQSSPAAKHTWPSMFPNDRAAVMSLMCLPRGSNGKKLAWLTSKCSSEVKITRMQLPRGAASRTLFVTHGIQTRGFNTILCSVLTAPRVTSGSSIQRSGVMTVCLLLGPDFNHIILWLYGANHICIFLSWLIFLSSNDGLSPSKGLSTGLKQRKYKNYDHLGQQVWLQDV